uniref:Putative RNA-binding eukaryotic snRNP-like protein n=1 Tax=uncultured marine thaumarchaeote SAT1000_13_B06 TaxID=1456381 RepID=A0A075IAQ1_9ARCH|nr:putative RNA-binding eukaryotic snRNP-like protein [uncultured marine thaumarchaeote SAT1000_13_B06]
MAKGSFMIEGQRNFIKISTLKLCVAIIEREGSYLLTCGPPSLKNNCVCYAIIEPEGSDMADVAKKFALNLYQLMRVLPNRLVLMNTCE